MERENADRRRNNMSLSFHSSFLLVLLLSLVVVVAGRSEYVGEREEWRKRVDDVKGRFTWSERESSFTRCDNITDGENLDHPAPSYVQTLQGSYTMIVEMTLRKKNVTFYVEEAREVAEVDGQRVNVGAVHITGNGTKLSYYYYPDDGSQMVEEMDGVCRMLGTEIPQFNPWGWWDPDPYHGDLLYGPAALLRRAYFTNKRYLGEDLSMINGVICECWQTCEGDNLILVLYCFSEKGVWVMPWTESMMEGEDQLPVTMEVMFADDFESIIYNVLLFVPFLVDPTMVQTPRGEECEDAVSLVPDAPLPRAESSFTLRQEIVRHPIIEGTDLGYDTQEVSEVKLSYSHPTNLVRYDYTPRPGSGSPYYTNSRLRVIHDFNTGVQYVIDEKLGNCTRSRIPSDFFDDDIGGLFGTGGNMVSPDELFHLDDSYALVGPRYSRLDSSAPSRTPAANLWSSTRSDIPDPSTGGLQNFPKAVLEYYFTKETQVTADGFEEVDIPVRADIFVYNSSNPFQVVGLRTTNIYDFSVVRQYVEDEFYVGECVEDQNQEGLGDISYILIVFPADEKQEAAVRDAVDVFKDQLFYLILQSAQISPTRIVTLDVTIDLMGPAASPVESQRDSRKDYGVTNTVMATATVLERPPYLLSYVEPMDDPNPVPGDHEDLISGVADTELCAKECSTYTTFPCKSFHLCGDQCYLSRVQGTDGEPQALEGCHLYVLSVANTSLSDPPTSQAYTLLLNAINAHLLTIVLPYGENDVELLSATEAFHYYGYDPSAVVRSEFKLQATSTVLTSPDFTQLQVASLDDCLTFCINWKEFRCVTVSYRFEPGEGSSMAGRGTGGVGGRDRRLGGNHGWRSNGRGGRGRDGREAREDGGGECMLSSIHFADLNSTDLKPDKIADVYSRLYVVEYDPVFGGVSLNTSGPVLSDVNSLDDCARYCTTETSFTCQSFEWCFGDKLCHLHSEHFLDVVDGGDYQTGTSCIHFSSKTDLSFTQYPNQGWPNDKHTFVSKESSASACAKRCIEETDEVCESFDFCSLCDEANVDVCGKEQLSFTNVCYLSTRHIGQPDMKLLTAPNCRHYSRQRFGDLDYPSFVASRTTEKYTAADMAWLGVSMVLLGVLLTLGFLYLMVATAPVSPPAPSQSAADPTSTPANQPVSYRELQSVVGESDT